jgi:oxygen-independent coproporphyrinogen-3 oxidase
VLLNTEEQQRRYVIKSILRADGVNRADFRKRFGCDCLDAIPQLLELLERKLATADDEVVRPTSAGLEWSDAIGPWLYSAEMQRRMGEFTWT